MAIGDEVWIDLDALAAAARDPGTSDDTRRRLFATLSHHRDRNMRLAGGSTDRENLLRIYRRRARRADPDGRLPAGTKELVRQLEQEVESAIALFALRSEAEVAYIFAREDLRSLVGCVVGRAARVSDHAESVGESDVTALVAILLDRAARIDERDDAAMYLGRSNDDAALTALLHVASDPGEEDLVQASSGESLARIFVRTGRLNPAWLHELTPVALHEVIPWVRRARPELLP
jgi:hypothetical protein